MKKGLSVILLLFICISVTSCSPNKSISESTPNSSEVNNNSIKEISLNEFAPSGLISYDNISLYGSYYTDTDGDLYMPFEYNKRFGYLDQSGNPVIENIDVNYSYQVYNFTDGFTLSSNQIIDKKGDIIFTLPDKWSSTSNGEGFIRYSGFIDGYATFFRNKSVDNDGYKCTELYIGLLDSNMNYTECKVELPRDCSIDQRYWQLINQKDFQGAVGEFQENGISKIAIINSAGKIISSFNSDLAHQTRKSAFSFISNNKNAENKNYNLTDMIFVKNGFVNVMNEDGKWGLLNLETGEMAIDYKYDYVGFCSGELVAVCQYGKWGIVNISDKIIFPCKSYKFIGEFVNDRAIAVSEDAKLCIINSAGEKVVDIDIDVDQSSRGGIRFTSFIEKTHIACIYSYDRAYIVSDSGKILLNEQIDPITNTENTFLYMNNNYLAFQGKNSTYVYKINH